MYLIRDDSGWDVHRDGDEKGGWVSTNENIEFDEVLYQIKNYLYYFIIVSAIIIEWEKKKKVK